MMWRKVYEGKSKRGAAGAAEVSVLSAFGQEKRQEA